MKIHIIACGVLRPDLDITAETLPHTITREYLEGGLHSEPGKLRTTLQEAIDRVSAKEPDDRPDYIAVGYGICGRGAVGIRARSVPLLIPKAHDCIALFLGSDEAYRREFSQCPGTYYISPGWYEEKIQPRGSNRPEVDLDTADRGAGSASGKTMKGPGGERSDRGRPGQQADYDDLASKYGNENADAILDFLSSWKRNYKRAAFIDTGGDPEKYETYAQALADEFGWRYERLQGSRTLLEKLLDPEGRHEEILRVPSGHTTVLDAISGTMSSVPESSKITRGKEADTTELYEQKNIERSDKSNQLPNQRVNSHRGRTSHDHTPSSSQSRSQPQRPSSAAVEADEPVNVSSHIGLGIDAGGTYTDAALYDFATKRVLVTGKALTTKWNYAIGIRDAIDTLIDRLDTDRPIGEDNGKNHTGTAGILDKIRLVAVSTTLATNAIVEGNGQPVGLILMPSTFMHTGEIGHASVSVVKGRIDINGAELEPVDPEEIRKVVRGMAGSDGVKAFAVSGYAGSVNPTHERIVKEIIQDETGLDVCLGSELSDLLDFTVRANTAVLNASIIPLLEQFLADIESSLKTRGITAPVMVVKGDGSLMGVDYAEKHPIETILSGPAASVAGANYLTAEPRSVVVDVGGTTSDIGRVEHGRIEVCGSGAKVGSWRTHVRALDMQTIGLGGDSEIVLDRLDLLVGPRRIAPVCWLAARADIDPALDYLTDGPEDFELTTRPMQILMLTGKQPPFEPTQYEKAIIDALESRPYSMAELSRVLGLGHWSLLRLRRLEAEYVVQRCGLTPTDVLHDSGTLSLWDPEASSRAANLFRELANLPGAELEDTVFGIITDRISREIVIGQLELQEAIVGDEGEAADVLLDSLIGKSDPDRLSVHVRLPYPIIGLGAAASYFLPAVADRLGTRLEIPLYAEVANAVGAITSKVQVERTATIVPTDTGGFLIRGITGGHEFPDMDEAYEYAEAELTREVQSIAAAAGTTERHVEVIMDDRITATAEGAELFLERVVRASLSGAPDGTPEVAIVEK